MGVPSEVSVTTVKPADSKDSLHLRHSPYPQVRLKLRKPSSCPQPEVFVDQGTIDAINSDVRDDYRVLGGFTKILELREGHAPICSR